MTRRPVISKSVIRRLKAQIAPPAHVQERVDALVLAGKLDAAAQALRGWHQLQQLETAALEALQDVRTLEDLREWRRRYIS